MDLGPDGSGHELGQHGAAAAGADFYRQHQGQAGVARLHGEPAGRQARKLQFRLRQPKRVHGCDRLGTRDPGPSVVGGAGVWVRGWERRAVPGQALRGHRRHGHDAAPPARVDGQDVLRTGGWGRGGPVLGLMGVSVRVGAAGLQVRGGGNRGRGPGKVHAVLAVRRQHVLRRPAVELRAGD